MLKIDKYIYVNECVCMIMHVVKERTISVVTYFYLHLVKVIYKIETHATFKNS